MAMVCFTPKDQQKIAQRICPYCDTPGMKLAGKTQGKQRLQCNKCNKRCVNNGEPVGRNKRLGEIALPVQDECDRALADPATLNWVRTEGLKNPGWRWMYENLIQSGGVYTGDRYLWFQLTRDKVSELKEVA